MQFISYRRFGRDGFGASSVQGVVDLGARLGGIDIAQALRNHGMDALRDAAARHSPDFPLDGPDGITRWRPVVADAQQIFCVGLNYEEHRVEAGRPKTAKPTIFLRLASSQIGHCETLLLPRESEQFDYEGEIAVVVGRGGRRIDAERAWDHLLGMACYNDGSIRDWQAHTSQWAPGKNFPATGAFGPSLVDAREFTENSVLTLTTRLNGHVMQQATTEQLIFRIPELIAYVSTFVELQPGDVVVTGTPGGVGFKRQPPVFMQDGDRVEVEVTGLGTLSNPVKREP
jgi:2-keto-4-pentenoate hydratase/2-oxohepta-3-ene-1,7-dioic acid hydratase in catechol pathway